MKITITRVDNGYIVESVGEESKVEVIVDSEPHSPVYGSIGGMQELLRTVMEKLGHYGSKHEKYRLRPVIIDQQADYEKVFKDADDIEIHNWFRERQYNE